MNGIAHEREGLAALMLRLRAEGIADSLLLKAIERTPRSLFMPPAFRDAAYTPWTVPIDCGASMEGADLVARLLHHLALRPGQRVLEIGTGSGFTAAVMARIVERVVTVERYRALHAQAVERFAMLGLGNIVSIVDDGRERGGRDDVFDRVLVPSAFTGTPRAFADRLVPGGIMIAAIGETGTAQTLVRLTKVGSRFEREDLFPVRFQPLAKGAALIM